MTDRLKNILYLVVILAIVYAVGVIDSGASLF